MPRQYNQQWWKEYYPKCKDKIRRRQLRNMYGITPEDYDHMLTEQNGVCSICKQPPQERKVRGGVATRLCVDHNHTTGKVRSLLCAPCNLIVGQLENNPELVSTIVKYLKYHV